MDLHTIYRLEEKKKKNSQFSCLCVKTIKKIRLTNNKKKKRKTVHSRG